MQSARYGLWSSRGKVAALAKRMHVSAAEVQRALAAEQAQQVTAQQRKVTKSDFMPTGGPDGTYQCDLLFFPPEYSRINHGFTCVLTVLDVNSRRAYAAPQKTKTVAETAKQFGAIADSLHPPCVRLVSDNGKEFTGKAFQTVVERHNITHVLVEPGDHHRLGRIDRFHRTLRTMLERWFVITGRHNWVDALSDIIANYNDSPHSSLIDDKSPADMGDFDTLRQRHKEIAAGQKVAATITLRVGDRVRHIVNRKLFEKGTKPRWSDTIHTVAEQVAPNLFRLDGLDGEYRHYELLKIGREPVITAPVSDSAEVAVERKRIRTTRALASEDIQPENVIEKKRVRKPTAVMQEYLKQKGKR